MLTGALKGLTEMDSKTLSEILVSLLQTVWPRLLTILQCAPPQPEATLSICTFLSEVIKLLSDSQSLVQVFDLDGIKGLAESLIKNLTTYPKNTCCVYTFTCLIKEMNLVDD